MAQQDAEAVTGVPFQQVFETEGDIGPRQRLTAAEAVRALAVSRMQPVEEQVVGSDR